MRTAISHQQSECRKIRMRSKSLCLMHYLCVVIAIALSTTSSLPSAAQVACSGAGISLVARLESLSVSVLPSAPSTAERGRERLSYLSVLTSSVLPSNRTTIRVFENGTPLYTQAATESGRRERRTDQVDLLPMRMSPEAKNPDGQRIVLIRMEAL